MATNHQDQAVLHSDQPLEKDFENGYHLDNNTDADTALKKIRTTGSLSISPELFEKIYLSPQNRVAGDLRKTFGNPTPVALGGFLLALSPLSCILMGWRGAGGNGASDIAVYYFFGCLLMVLGGVGEWILGNTFPCVVFTTFGAFWGAFGGSLQPFYNTYGAYSTTGVVADGLKTQSFNASFAFFPLFMAVLCFCFMICALRTNVIFLLIFVFLTPAFACIAASFWYLAEAFAITDNTEMVAALMQKSSHLLIAAGALTFVVDWLGWWIFLAILLASLDFPFQLPVGDLSRIIRGASDRAKSDDAV